MARKSGFDKARTSVLKSLRNLEETVAAADQAHATWRDMIAQKDGEGIAYWRAVIEAFRRSQS